LINCQHGLLYKIKKLKFPQLKLEIKENNWGKKISSSFSLTDKIYSILDDAKAEDIKVIDLRKKSSVADFFVISTCRSTRHADATADEVSKQLKKLGYKNPSPEGRPKCDWVIVDAGSVIVHLFRKETREIYNLEQLWETNFESEKSKLAN
jgi:ribosome-associated protein